MYFRILVFISSALLSFNLSAQVPVIFDTDMESDCDDGGALAMLHAYADQGKIKIIATPISARYQYSGACVDAINTYFGRPDIPIGIPKATPCKQKSKFAKEIAREFPHDFPAGNEQPDALKVYRKVLLSQEDNSVVIITVGDLTNIRDLLDSPADEISSLSGMELVRKKVKHWYCMGSRYPKEMDPGRWGNFKMDPKATTDAIARWPVKLTFTGGGDFAWKLATGKGLSSLPKTNPVRRVYELYFDGKVKNRHSADQITVMVAIEGTGSPWKLVTEGYNHIFQNGNHEWKSSPDNPNQAYISTLEKEEDYPKVAARIEELMKHMPKK